MNDMKASNPSDIAGELLTDIDIGGDEILLSCASGRRYKFFHDQDCCERVIIEQVDGDPLTLKGMVIRAVEFEAEPGGEPRPNDPFCESWTRTMITFRTDDATVVTRWLGESNGYYSENVDLIKLPDSAKLPPEGD